MDRGDKGGKERTIKGGKFLTFLLHGEEYGLEILKVREIIGLMKITSVPRTPEYVKGVINLRGKVIPVVDLRLKFGLKQADYNNETCIIVVDVMERIMGIVVDTVSEVIDIEEGKIEESPSFGRNIRTELILGMGKINGRVKILLDIEKVLTSEEFIMMNEIAEHKDHEDENHASPDLTQGKECQVTTV